MVLLSAPPTPAPVFDPIVRGEALAQEVRTIAGRITQMSPEQLAIAVAWTAGVIVGALALLWALRFVLRLLARWLSPMHEKHSEQGKAARKQVGGWTIAVARFAIGIVAVAVVLDIWGFDVRDGPLGALLGVIWRAGFIILFAIGAIELFSFVVGRALRSSASRTSDPRRAAQLRTLVPVLTGVVTAVIAITAFTMTLSEFGVDIGPLIAGAGIVGLAIGFGAQTLVKDFLTGLFLLLEDTVSIGDIATIGGFGGVVEDMSLRTIKLRDFDGTLHIFPYSEAMVIHNQTKGFSYAVFELSVDYAADIGSALDLMRKVGEDLRKDPELGPRVRDDIEVVGVESLAESAVILKARIKTAPAAQWPVKREYLKRIKLAFDEAGIKIPFPHLKLVAPDPVAGPSD